MKIDAEPETPHEVLIAAAAAAAVVVVVAVGGGVVGLLPRGPRATAMGSRAVYSATASRGQQADGTRRAMWTRAGRAGGRTHEKPIMAGVCGRQRAIVSFLLFGICCNSPRGPSTLFKGLLKVGGCQLVELPATNPGRSNFRSGHPAR